MALAGILLLAAPVIDRVQRLSSPAEAGGTLPASDAAESALDLGAAAQPRRAIQPERGAPVRPPEPGSAAPATAGSETTPTEAGDDLALEHPGYGAPTWLKIPAIDSDSPIQAVGIQDERYQTAQFRVGHHEDSADPGALGNSVYNGHVTSLTDGRVFARLNEVGPGDSIAIYTATHRTEWEIVAAGWMSADEAWYIQPTRDIRITLYTCGGDFDFTRLDYTHRYVVIAGLVRAVPLADEAESVE